MSSDEDTEGGGSGSGLGGSTAFADADISRFFANPDAGASSKASKSKRRETRTDDKVCSSKSRPGRKGKGSRASPKGGGSSSSVSGAMSKVAVSTEMIFIHIILFMPHGHCALATTSCLRHCDPKQPAINPFGQRGRRRHPLLQQSEEGQR